MYIYIYFDKQNMLKRYTTRCDTEQNGSHHMKEKKHVFFYLTLKELSLVNVCKHVCLENACDIFTLITY